MISKQHRQFFNFSTTEPLKSHCNFSQTKPRKLESVHMLPHIRCHKQKDRHTLIAIKLIIPLYLSSTVQKGVNLEFLFNAKFVEFYAFKKLLIVWNCTILESMGLI